MAAAGRCCSCIPARGCSRGVRGWTRWPRRYRVIAPHHPGFGGSALPDWFGTVDDLAYLYLDLAAALDLHDAVLAGACFGGWVAAEMAVRNTQRFAGSCWRHRSASRSAA